MTKHTGICFSTGRATQLKAGTNAIASIVKNLTLAFTARSEYGIWSVVSSYFVCIGIRKLSAMLKATQGLHSHYDEVNMEPYSESIIQNFYEAQCEECGEGVTSNDVTMEDNPAHESMNLLQ